MSLTQDFDNNGYAIVRSVFSADDVARLRNSADRITAAPSDHPSDTQDHPKFGTGRCDIYARFPELQWVLFHPPLLAGLKQILGSPVVFIPEHPLQKGFFSNWHRDTSAPRQDGQTFYLEPDFRVAQVAIYLQDNSIESGGGLDVVPRSHREVHLEWLENIAKRAAESVPLPFGRGRHRVERLFTFPARISGLMRDPVSLPIVAGDVVVFDIRIRHRATRGPVPSSKPKYGLFLVCSANNKGAEDYLHYVRDIRKNGGILSHKFTDELKAKGKDLGVIYL
jgi:ectoine hydroxylase-related dioxygenase (phytanoyl-CoA dioxygenase family)